MKTKYCNVLQQNLKTQANETNFHKKTQICAKTQLNIKTETFKK